MNRIISDNLNDLNEICKKHNVKVLFAFGSVCTKKFNDSSDIDFLVSFQPLTPEDYADAYFSLADSLEKLFNRKVDLVTIKSLSNLYLIKTVEKTKTALYAA
jgi:hypothetical protein